MSVRLIIEYDGRAFKGWARQPGHRTVQEEVEKAIEIVAGEPATLTVAGRTDAGVHAWGQVASYAGEPVPVRSFNALLPDDVTVLAADAVEDEFDARDDAVSRMYCYRVWTRQARPALLRGRAWHWSWDFDRALLDACAELLVGAHDFEAFTLSDQPYKTYRRTIARTKWVQRPGGLLEFWIEGDSFTRRMTRTLVAYQLETVRGLHTLDEFERLLAGAKRADAGHTAPAEGLYLASVGYPAPLPAAVEFGRAPG